MTAYFLIIAAGLGLIMGSFLSMLIPRLHNDEKGIVKGRSHCFHCKKTLSVSELIPLVSYLIQGGKCKHCRKSIPAWYPIIELTTAITFVVLFFEFLDPTLWLINIFYFSVLLFILFYDLRYKEIHDAVMLPAIVVALILSIFTGNVVSSMIGGGIGFGFFALQYFASQGRWIGAGDMRIGAFIGLMLGWQLTLLALMLSYIFGSLISIALLVSGKADRKTAIPLGPFIVVGTMLAFFFGEKLIWLYLNLAL